MTERSRQWARGKSCGFEPKGGELVDRARSSPSRASNLSRPPPMNVPRELRLYDAWGDASYEKGVRGRGRNRYAAKDGGYEKGFREALRAQQVRSRSGFGQAAPSPSEKQNFIWPSSTKSGGTMRPPCEQNRSGWARAIKLSLAMNQHLNFLHYGKFYSRNTMPAPKPEGQSMHNLLRGQVYSSCTWKNMADTHRPRLKKVLTTASGCM